MKEPTEVEKKYLKYLEEHPGATSAEIVKAWKMKPETVASRLSVMWTAGFISRTENLQGKGYRYWSRDKGPAEAAALSLTKENIAATEEKLTSLLKPDPSTTFLGGLVATRDESLSDLVDQFVLTLSEEIVRRVRPMVVEKLSASVASMTREIVQTIPSPKPQLKRILICGLQDGYGKMVQKEFEGVAEIRYLSPEASFDRLKSNSTQVEHVVVAADFVGHKHTEAIQSTGVKPILVRGGLTKIKDKLMELSV